MAKEESITMEGASGTRYNFDVYRWGTSFKSLGAVYSVLKKNTNGRYNVLYVGQTGNLDERFDNHHRADCFTRNGRTHIGIHLESSEQTRLSKERDLINHYNPPCNRA